MEEQIMEQWNTDATQDPKSLSPNKLNPFVGPFVQGVVGGVGRGKERGHVRMDTG